MIREILLTSFIGLYIYASPQNTNNANRVLYCIAIAEYYSVAVSV